MLKRRPCSIESLNVLDEAASHVSISSHRDLRGRDFEIVDQLREELVLMST